MQAGIRLLLAAALCAGFALCFGQALADGTDTHELVVAAFDTRPGVYTDLDLELYVPKTAANVGNVTVDVPAGYQIDTPLGPGTTIGPAEATVLAGGVDKQISGTLRTGDPAAFASVAQTCDPNPHAVVWVAAFDVAGQTVTVPIFVDRPPAGDTTDSFVLEACFPPADVAPAAGAPPNLRFEDFDVTPNGVFQNPPRTSTPEWRAFFTAYSAGTGTLDPQTTVEARCRVPLPHAITNFKVAFAKKPKHFPNVIITGRLLAAGQPRTGVDVRIDAGTTLDNLAPWAVAVTDGQGRFRIDKPLRKKLFAFVYVDVYYSLTCSSTPTTAPGGCVREDTSPELGPLGFLKPRP